MEQWLLTRLRMGRIFGHKGNVGHFTTTDAVTAIVIVIDIDGTGGCGSGIRYHSCVVTRTITPITIVVIIATIIVMVVEQIRRLVQMILE